MYVIEPKLEIKTPASTVLSEETQSLEESDIPDTGIKVRENVFGDESSFESMQFNFEVESEKKRMESARPSPNIAATSVDNPPLRRMKRFIRFDKVE